MGGFLNSSLNNDFRQGLAKIIIHALVKSCEFMESDCLAKGIKINNNENEIRNYLVENYLDNDKMHSLIGLEGIHLRFYPEMAENYVIQTNSYLGRTDIRVVSGDTLRNRNDYFIIECKRIDGTRELYKKYIEEGICRFTGNTPKYLSYNGTNFMLGFVVSRIDFAVILAVISSLHIKTLGSLVEKNLTVLVKETNYTLCKSTYTNALILNHLLFNMSAIIK